MFIVLIVGFLVTETGSSQGCGPHWPLCDGHFTPPFDLHGLVEYGHRAVSGIIGIMVVVLAVWSWRRLRTHREVLWLSILAVAFTYIQAALGAAAVLSPTSPFILASHFGVSLVAFAAVLLLDVRIVQEMSAAPPGEAAGRGWTWRERDLPAGLRRLVFWSTAYLLMLVYLGALVAHTDTGLLCRGWPLCRGSLFPPLQGELAIPYLHRVGALGAVLLLVWVYLWARRVADRRPDVARAALASLLLVLAQSLAGWYLVASGLPLRAIMLHVALMTFLFGSMSYLSMQALRSDAIGKRTERRAART